MEQDEYVGPLTESAGIRVTIHPQDRHPFPEEDGFDVSPGSKTAVGLMKVNLLPRKELMVV